MKFEIVVVGTSAGGFNALSVLLSGLPPAFPWPLAVVQHRGRSRPELLAALLQQRSPLPVREAGDKQPFEPGQVFIAPSDYHLLVDEGYFSLSTEGPVEYARPSIDVLFDSAAYVYGAAALGIILTGANRDGAWGAARLKQAGGRLLVQDPATAENKVMPCAALSAGPDWVKPLPEIAPFIAELAQIS